MATARIALFELLTNDAQLNALGVTAASTYNANDVDSPEQRPFLMIVWREETRAFGATGRRLVTIWAHDKGTSYQTIDRIISRVQELLTGSVHVTGSDGSRISSFTDLGTSGDLRDDGYGTITRNTTWEALPHR